MRYLGGKYRVAKHIAEHINAHQGVFLEPFMGSCWITAKAKHRVRLAGDIHDELVTMYHRVVYEGWKPPDQISAEKYADIRDNKTTGKYPPELVAFAGFGCAYAGGYFRMYAGEIHAARSKRSVLKKAESLQGTKFFTSDYRDLNPQGCIIYCDPPYEGKYAFRITGVRGNGSFENREFWEVMDKWSESNIVYISELQAPKGYECVMEVPITACIRSKKGCDTRYERLFRKKKKVRLVSEDEPNLLDILGVAPDWKGFKDADI